MKDQENHEICIVGDGPTGLICACMFAQCGFDIALVSPDNNANDDRTTAFLHHSFQILETIGLWSGLSESAASLKGIRIIDDTGRLFRAPETVFSSSEIGLEAFGYNIPNRELMSVLRKQIKKLKNLTIYPAIAASIVSSDRISQVRLDSGKTISCQLVVGADGRNSMVRKSAGIQFREWTYGQSALVANLCHSQPHRNVSTEFHTENGPFTLVPLSGDRSSLVCVDTHESVKKLIEMSPDALAEEFERRGKSILGRFDIEGKCQIFPISGRIAETSGQNRCVLVGESAHVLPPIGAQGLNLGIRDIAWLGEVVVSARKKRSDIGGNKTISEYNRTRRYDTKLISSAVDMLNRSLLSSFVANQLARTFGVYMVNRITPLRKLVMQQGLGQNRILPKLARGISIAD